MVGYFFYITKDWQPWYIMCTALQVLILICMFMLPESPEFYFAKGKFDNAKQVLLRIAALNGRKIDERQICFDKVASSSHDHG